MPVVSIKVPDQIKEKMEKYKDRVHWPDEIRKLIAAKLEEIERSEIVSRAMRLLEGIPPAGAGTAESLVREDRESH
ncbi:MAG: hypothetical protein QXE79_05775 [Candidatus Bathyarchaeia archaeon]